ncbi:MAG: Serine O-acetyltransferase [Candidatus Uhrbacteria bacterium GW2011_GWF2_39_13]|uniref:serine O-acetyltransferase n=1 Tax=Candidatus Uhrbacteria bacterium GW2011_GWF2_39_13 TaxID=1618995 RepID=A0A0G0PZP1_9BACT|nr:MAG: Serine O-acetyltransferase [Candidatus Uhrbacteria bacterium GW2011_GWF2_39_13]
MQKCTQGKCAETVTVSCDFVDALVGRICDTYQDGKGINHIEGFNLPKQSEVLEILHKLVELIFPGFSGQKTYSILTVRYNIGEIISSAYIELYDQIFRSFRYNCEMKNCKDCDLDAISEKAAKAILDSIPEIREVMKLDIEAAFEGDPAASSLDEIVMSYPGLRAIAIQRLSHVLYHEGVPLIPRMMTEYAHSVTGIDIHPGAHLGKGIFIDHGTGVVIGETAQIGDNVKIYQGVTLGALSFPKDACGKIIKGAKRHPTLEDKVTIYSGATILGNVVIGRGSIIGGNVWLTESVGPGTKITIPNPELTIQTRKK